MTAQPSPRLATFIIELSSTTMNIVRHSAIRAPHLFSTLIGPGLYLTD
jgi:hypothetical protein